MGDKAIKRRDKHLAPSRPQLQEPIEEEEIIQGPGSVSQVELDVSQFPRLFEPLSVLPTEKDLNSPGVSFSMLENT